jgi:hypothetical protein
LPAAVRIDFDAPTFHAGARMTHTILRYGLIAGLIVAIPNLVMFLSMSKDSAPLGGGYFIGYTIMIVAFTTVFLGIKHYRDKVLGGVIRFLPAFAVGLGISAVAGILYVIAWEISIAFSSFDFSAFWRESMIESAKARGASPEELQKTIAEADDFLVWYANPIYRMPMTFIEIFPVGVLVSLISAAVLRNSRVLPARQP